MTFKFVLSYALTSWNVRMEEWTTTVFLTALFPNSLLPVSLYSLSSSACAIVFGGFIGKTVDYFPRLPVALTFLAIQKLMIAAISTMMWSLVDFEWTVGDRELDLDQRFMFILFCGCVLKLANTGTQISVERDWTMVIARDHDSLSVLNSRLKLVDLVCKLGAPLAISAVIVGVSIPVTMVTVAGFSILSTLFEWIFIVQVYFSTPNLAIKYTSEVPDEACPILDESSRDTIITRRPQEFWEMTKTPEFLTCISISLLYYNVLSFGSVMTAYLISLSMSPALLAILRGFSVVAGIVATQTFPSISRRLGLARIGLWSINTELIFIGLACSSFFVNDSTTSLTLLIAGVSLSRWGLWSFDLTQTQIIQTR